MSRGTTLRRVGLSIRYKLEEGLKPVALHVTDESHRHSGHKWVQESGRANQETHFNVHVVSDAFQGKSLVLRHRLCYSLIDEELKGGVHAVALTTLTPAEAKENSEVV